MRKKTLQFLAVGGAVALLASGAAAYYVSKGDEQQVASNDTPATYSQPVQTAQPQAQQPACDDGNVVGMAAGAIMGGLAGNQVGKGDGKTVATVGGAAGGAYLGQKYIPTNGATCR